MLKQIDKEKLLSIINNYLKQSTFYQNKYKKISISDFESLPLLNKKELLDDQKQYPPYGSNLLIDPKDITRIHRTSGTTNSPLLIALTKNDIEKVVSVGANLFKLVGMNKDDTVINCLNYNMWMGGYTDHQSMEKTGTAVIPYGTGHTDNLLSLILSLQNSSLHCTPSYLSVLKEKAKVMGIKPKELNIQKGFFAAEGGLQNNTFRKKIEEEWGLEAFNANYGLSEVISILGSECKNKNGLHFGAGDYLYIELLDEELNSIPIKKGAKGELVLTHLEKESQPLIRYKTGDIIEILSINECDCGFEGFKFNIIGRADDMLVIKGVNFFPESIRSIISNFKELSGNYKVIAPKQEPINEIKLIIELQNNQLEDSLKIKIMKTIKERLNITPTIEFTTKIEYNGNKIKLLERVSDVQD